MKRFALLVLVLVLAVAGCSGSGNGSAASTVQASSAAAAAAAPSQLLKRKPPLRLRRPRSASSRRSMRRSPSRSNSRPSTPRCEEAAGGSSSSGCRGCCRPGATADVTAGCGLLAVQRGVFDPACPDYQGYSIRHQCWTRSDVWERQEQYGCQQDTSREASARRRATPTAAGSSADELCDQRLLSLTLVRSSDAPKRASGALRARAVFIAPVRAVFCRAGDACR